MPSEAVGISGPPNPAASTKQSVIGTGSNELLYTEQSANLNYSVFELRRLASHWRSSRGFEIQFPDGYKDAFTTRYFPWTALHSREWGCSFELGFIVISSQRWRQSQEASSSSCRVHRVCVSRHIVLWSPRCPRGQIYWLSSNPH